MNVPYGSFLSSPIVLIRGPNHKTFSVHSALITKHSKVLDRDVNGFMKEAEDGIIHIADVDDDIDDNTVMCFIEYAYTGDYTVPDVADLDGPLESNEKAEKLSEQGAQEREILGVGSLGVTTELHNNALISRQSSNSTQQSTSHEDDGWGFPARYQSKKKKKGLKTNASQAFWAEAIPAPYPEAPSPVATLATVEQLKQDLWAAFVSQARPRSIAPWEPRQSKSSDNQVEDLLCHARLYVLSSRYECAPLAELTLQKLRLTLSRRNTGGEPGSAVRLMEWVSLHTQDYEKDCDRLRLLVIEYAVCHLETFVKQSDFRHLLGQKGSFAADLVAKAMARLGC